ncbi:porin [Rubrivivax gelatinosus]|nr:porin [Rubrivivax gelatinosus]
MTIRLYSVVAAAGLGAAPALAESSISIGGSVDVGVRQVKNGALGRVRSSVSGANSTSKLVLRGQEDLGAGLSAGFYLDATIFADSGGTSTPFWDRRSTLSLAHRNWGELRLGRDWVTTHLVWSAADPFATLGIAGANTFRSTQSRAIGQAFGSTAAALAQSPTLRVANVVEYVLPSGLAGFSGALMASAGEGGSAGTGSTRGDGWRLGWTDGRLNLGAAQFTTRNANGGQVFQDQAWGASWDFGLLRASAGQRRWVHGSDRTTNTLLGAVIPAGPGVVKLSHLRANQQGASAALSANDASLTGAGYVYKLSRRSALYAHVARLKNQGGATFTIAGGAATSALPAAPNYFGGQTSTACELGLRHDF